ncbi:hypothetical protein Avbf_00750 [Armadillidium vulgare]|nr:hypothetical protein Avbf_00750 [Armadillidium vulgare]
MTVHPDRNAQNSKNHKLAVAVNEAYAVLGKSPSRENYDHHLSHLRRQLSHNSIVSDIPYDRVVFRDRDYFYEDTVGRNRRFYEESFYRGRKGFDGEKPYYGIKGVKRLPNSYIAAGIVMFMMLGSLFHYYISTLSTRYCLNQLHERDENLKKIYQSVRENAMRNGMEKQQELFRKQYLEKNSSKVGEELRRSHD